MYLAIACLLVLILAPIAPLLQLTINNVPKVYLPEDARAVIIDEQVREFFPNDQGMAFLFEGPDLYADQFLLALDALTRALQSHPQIEKVFSVTSQDHIVGTEDGFLVEPLLDVDELDHWSEDYRRQRILSDRFARRALVAPDGSALAVVVIPDTLDDSFARMDLHQDILGLLHRHQLEGHLVAEAGLISTDVEQTREFLRQMMLFIPLIVAIGLLLVWLLFHRLLALLLSLAAIFATVGSTVALFTLFSLPFNLISSILPPLLCALTIAALVHLFNALKLAARRGASGPNRVATALHHVRRPGLYNALTTMAGFAALGLSEIPPIRNLGLVTAAGVGLVYVVVYHLLPPIIASTDRGDWGSRRAGRSLSDTAVRVLFHTGTRHPVATLLTTLLLLGAGAPFLGRIVVETNLLEFFSPEHEIRVATEHLEQKLAGTGSMDVLLTASEPQGLISPQNLRAIRQFQTWAESQDEVDKTTSLADFVEEMHWGFNGGEDRFRTIPDRADLISQYLFVYDGTDLYDFVDRRLAVSRVHLNLNIHGARDIQQFMQRVRTYLEAQPMDAVSWEIAGMSRLFSDQVNLLISGQLSSILGALVIIFLLMLLQWRSLRDALVCMLPNLAPVLLIFIVMGAFNIWLDVATAMIASVAVGIAIDDTIHIFHGFIYRLRRGISPVIAIARTCQHAGRAVMTTTTILCAQFLVLLASDFVPIMHFGLLASIGLLAALVFDLLLLPAILILSYRRREAP
ncbi:MMPL family transporter [Haliea sp. E1-2-M8]|uniref:efflux RND transporter permease subunit n=1 Tax=Haliea sp. E1-2-M8 TaxID=3064706 RepID=UPI00271D257D|nr:MMPL family transporter [Haliea sp. E1-2-M8]MDO8863752.1 MMPL family transporter [Haliea sp. E1-2-M8]